MKYLIMLISWLKSFFKHRKKSDTTKFTQGETEILCAMWDHWKSGKSNIKTQNDFMMNVNMKFGTNKSKSAIIKYTKKAINERVQRNEVLPTAGGTSRGTN